MTQASARTPDLQSLDALTGGAFTAPTSGDRASRVRAWLASDPSAEQMRDVFKELSGRDKGAARLLRERLDEQKRARDQETIAAEWEARAQALLAQARVNIADSLAWQRDAAKAGAPLSREPLASLKTQLSERIRLVEDLQHRAQVQREAALLLAQRFDVLSTKGWRDAQGASDGLTSDVARWRQQADALRADSAWSSLDPRFAPQLEASASQLQSLSDAFAAALTQAAAAAADAAAPLPPVPVWADELRADRGQQLPREAGAGNAGPPAPTPAERTAGRAAPKIDAGSRAAANEAVQTALARLELETAQGHGKASAGAAAALRVVLKAHGKAIDSALESRVHTALVAAGELEGWQRWGADQMREDLVARAEALLKRPEGQALGGRKMQESLRTLRDQWKKADAGGAANHALWKRFDQACNDAHKVVEAWLEKLRADATAHRAARLALIDEVKAWAEAHAVPTDLKAHHRALHQFADRWRDAGHVGDKIMAELMPAWEAAFGAAREPFESEQQASLARRQSLIAEAEALGASAQLRIDAVTTLQKRWQAEAQSVPLERRQEQKMWDAFRAPIDNAFKRKDAERQQVSATVTAHERQVLAASKALDAANASGDAQRIRTAMMQLEAVLRGEVTDVRSESDTRQATPAATVSDAPAAQPTPVTPTSHVNTAQSAPQDLAERAAALEFSEASMQAPSPEELLPAVHAPTPEPGDGDLVAPVGTADAAAMADGEPASGAAHVQVTGSAGAEVADLADPAGASDVAPSPTADEPPAAAAVAPKPAAKPVVAVRGDDRPGNRRGETAQAPSGRRDGPPGRGGPGPGGRPGGREDRGGASRGTSSHNANSGGGRFGDRQERPESRGPRLGDAAFRAQRQAFENAQAALRKLSAQAHGEALTQLLGAWVERDAKQLPGVQELGRSVSPAVRGRWAQAIEAAPSQGSTSDAALLRLEMAAELPTPAEHLDARRALQLQLLTRRNDPPPTQTWGDDAANVLASPHDEARARRLQNALKTLLRG